MRDSVRISKKVVLLGDPSVGKTSLARKFVYDIFDDKYISTLGTKITKKQLVYEKIHDAYKIELTLLVWDVMGQHDFSKFHTVAFTGCKGALIVCDITRDETINNWRYWKNSVMGSEGKIPIVLIGNKYDLAKKYKLGVENFKTASNIAKYPSFFTSAKNGENVEEAFFILGKKILECHFVEKQNEFG